MTRETPEPTDLCQPEPFSKPTWSRVWLATGLHLLVIWTLCAELPPGINESHYLTKAKHAWDPSFAPRDLFLSSGNAHWLFSQVAGWMSTWLPLTAVAWIGRIACWAFMSLAWARCAARLYMSAIHSACVLAAWILATRMGNWAGEWAIGGFEAKSIAYPCIVLAIENMLVRRWPRVWIFCGLAVAFHPLVGGWAGVSLLAAWLWFGRESPSLVSDLTRQLPAMTLAGGLSLIGLAPALAMISGPSRQGEIVVAQIHAFYRLAHHQAPHLFWANQHIAGACSLMLLSLTTLALRWTLVRNPAPELRLAARMTQLAWLSLAISAVGLAIDLVGIRLRPDIAASLLRFYWFRWSDIMVPLAWVSTAWMLGIAWQHWPLDWRSTPAPAQMRLAGLLLSTLCALSLLGVGWNRVSDLLSNDLAPADRTLLMSDNSTLASGPEVAYEWLAVCNWVRENTPSDALFLTPRAQQTFKWYAHRAEVATFKDVPQDGRSLLEWFDRIGRIAPPRDEQLRPLGWTDRQIQALHRRYKFDYLIVDRRIQKQPPGMQLVYPQSQGMQLIDGTYAIYKMPQLPANGGTPLTGRPGF